MFPSSLLIYAHFLILNIFTDLGVNPVLIPTLALPIAIRTRIQTMMSQKRARRRNAIQSRCAETRLRWTALDSIGIE